MPVEPGCGLRLSPHHSCFASLSPRLLARPNAPAGPECSGACRSLDGDLGRLLMPMRKRSQANGRSHPPPLAGVYS